MLLVIELTRAGLDNHRIEVAVKDILSGRNVKANASVANPEALDWFRDWFKRTETTTASR